jgi:hypothetical protein
MIVIVNPNKLKGDSTTYRTQKELEDYFDSVRKEFLNYSWCIEEEFDKSLEETFRGIKVGQVYYRTIEDENGNDVLNRYIKINHITFFENQQEYLAFITSITEENGAIELTQGYTRPRSIIDPCTVEIDRIPDIVKEKIIKLINI